MSYKALVRNNVRKAFSLVKDLGQDVVFKRLNKNNFDFSTGLAVQSYIEEIHKVIIIDTKNKERNALEKTVLVNTEFLPLLKLSEIVNIDGKDYKVGNVIEHNEYLTQFFLFNG